MGSFQTIILDKACEYGWKALGQGLVADEPGGEITQIV